ncbi:hypothetical protein TRFO_27444 [Tritrichomonas foetus]|uniref:SMP-LTD domain-containing protein n=1 Tax=Tritrichomonas foetus TaxID=1144522 RepID=A0A1J4K5J5_9EUKA|nr:hypothetical protein TRFO_27444 [Tritrichomonas foetus]|eukprot:OHT04942.1 hypothetical protein TRFO_27444 [Tritrichomonas foetus]
MNSAFAFGFITVNIVLLVLFLYAKKHGLEFFRSFLTKDHPSTSPILESSIWFNTLVSRFFTHIRDPKVAAEISKNITFLPHTRSFKIVTIGSDIEFGQFKTVPPTSISPQQVQVPVKWGGFSFDIQTDLFKAEVDFRQFESTLAVAVLKDGIQARLVGETKCDFDLSIILWKKYMITECPIIGDLVRVLFVYYAQRKDVIYALPPLQTVLDNIEEQNVVPTKVISH